jgi:hypothetical protein
MRNLEWQEDVKDVTGKLGEMAEHADRPVGERSICWAAALLLKLLGEALAAAGAASAPQVAKLPPPTKTGEGHRHVYDDSGRCKLAQSGGSGICGAMSRGAKKAAAVPAPAAGEGGS